MFEIRDIEWRESLHESASFWCADMAEYLYDIVKFPKSDFCLQVRLKKDGSIVAVDPIDLTYYKTLDEAKQKANAHWRGILKEFLREV